MALTQISTAGVKDDAVTAGKIPADAVGSSELADNAVDTAAIADDAVTDAKLANSINSAIAANTAKTTNATHTGDVTGSTSLTIANDAVTTAKLTVAAKNAEDGLVKYLRTSVGTFTIITPDGSTVSTSGTTTEGLQEAINYANNNGFDFYCAGGGIEADGTATDVGVVTCTTTLNIPACQLRSMVFKSITIDFTTAVGSNAGLKFDSFMMLDFDFAGQIVYHGNGNAVEFDAVTNVPFDAFKTQVDSRIKIDTIAYVEGGTDASPSSACISFKQTQGAATLRNSFIFGEINGSGYNAGTATVTLVARNGIVLNHSGVKYNIFDIQGIHHFKEAGLIVGQSVSSPAPAGNQFRIGVMEPYRVTSGGSVVALGLRSYANHNHYTFSITNNGGTNQNGITGAFAHALKFESSCSEEFVNLLDCVGATTGIITSSSSNNNTLYHKGAKLDGNFLVGTPIENVFNGAGGNSQMVVAGTDTTTNVVSNVNSSITISNKDGTANNLAGLHFAREDNDGSPHYCGASIVAQFKEAQTDSTYPSADLNFLTSHSHGAAPRVAATLHRPGYLTLPYHPYAMVSISGNVSVSNVSGTTVPFDSQHYDVGDHYNTSNYRFTAPVSGVYQVNIQIQYTGNINQLHAGCEKNGGNPGVSSSFDPWCNYGDNQRGGYFAQAIYMAANDYIQARTYHSNGSAANLEANRTKMTVYLLG